MSTVTGQLAIRAVQLRAQIGAVKLEKLGLRRSGGNITPQLKKFYGLPRTAKHDDVLASLHDDVANVDEQLLASANSEETNA